MVYIVAQACETTARGPTKPTPWRRLRRKMLERTEDGPRSAARALLRGLFDAAVAAVHPAHALPSALPAPPAAGRILLLSTGKGGGSMMTAAVRHYRDALGLPDDRLFGVGAARHGYEDSNPVIPMIGAGHPVPDEGSLEAARRTLAAAARGRPRRYRRRPHLRRRLRQLDRSRGRGFAGREAGAEQGPAAVRRGDRRDELRAQASVADQGRPARGPHRRRTDSRLRHLRRAGRRSLDHRFRTHRSRSHDAG